MDHSLSGTMPLDATKLDAFSYVVDTCIPDDSPWCDITRDDSSPAASSAAAANPMTARRRLDG